MSLFFWDHKATPNAHGRLGRCHERNPPAGLRGAPGLRARVAATDQVTAARAACSCRRCRATSPMPCLAPSGGTKARTRRGRGALGRFWRRRGVRASRRLFFGGGGGGRRRENCNLPFFFFFWGGVGWGETCCGRHVFG